MKTIKLLLLLLVAFVSIHGTAVAQQCSTPLVTNYQDGSIGISYNCQILQPGQNSPFTEQSTVTAQLSGPKQFSSVTLAYEGGYQLYGGSITTTMTLEDLHSPDVDVLQFVAVGPGSQSYTYSHPLFYLIQDVFRVVQNITLGSNSIANCYAFCGYTVNITLRP
jgi:hypothetical protein